MLRRVQAAAGWTAIAAVLMSGCGGTDTPTPAPSVASAKPANPDDRVAREAIIRLDAFPAGWLQGERGKGGSACLSPVRRAASGTAASPSFRHQSQQAQSAAYVFQTTAEARQALRRLTSAQTRRCYARESSEAFRAHTDTAFQRVQAQALDVRGFGAEGGGSRMRFSPSVQNHRTDVVIDLVALRVGRVVGLELLFGSPRPLDARVQARLAQRHVALLRTATEEPPAPAA
ncbi:MAG: hypothetical protein JHC95_22865 [Solirubrobacteraceae bacterium]|nr:hypothetical protein [Solirubrobacteraceae bacterium]